MKGGGKDLASLAAASKGRRDESGEAADAADDGWILGVKLGSGTFGDVHKAYTTRREGSKVWACKQLKDLKKVPKLEREFELMKGCKHVHIIQYDSVDLARGRLYMEYAGGGTLDTYINGNPLDVESIRNFTAQILMALDYLYGKGIIHEDLKSENIFLAEDNSVKVGDFGNVMAMQPMHRTGTGGSVRGDQGTVLYSAPEVLTSSKHGRTVDVWSLGCIVWEMGTGKRPFHEHEFEQHPHVIMAVGLGYIGTSYTDCATISLRPVDKVHEFTEVRGKPAAKCKLCKVNDVVYECSTCKREGRIYEMCLPCNTKRHLLTHGVSNSSFEREDDKDALPFLLACFRRNQYQGSYHPDTEPRPTPAELLAMPFVAGVGMQAGATGADA